MKKIFSLILILVLLCACALAEGTLNVTGNGTVYIPADTVNVTLGVNMTGSDIAKMQREVNERINAICQQLAEAGLAENAISTNSIYIYPQYDYSSDIQRLVGHNITSSINISTNDVDNIGKYIDIAIEAGANTFDSINFSASDTTAAKLQALEIAVKNAMGKAEVMAAACGGALGELKTVSEGSESYYYEDNAGDARMYAVKEEAAAGTSVYAAQISVSASVSLTYELR